MWFKLKAKRRKCFKKEGVNCCVKRGASPGPGDAELAANPDGQFQPRGEARNQTRMGGGVMGGVRKWKQ